MTEPDTDVDTEPTTEPDVDRPTADRRRALLAALPLFFLSGAAALAYELVWLRSLALILGSSTWAVATVVATFMAGLGLGSWWAAGRADGWPRPLRAYARLELAIGLLGGASFLLLGAVEWVVGPLYRLGSPLFPLARLGLCALVLLLPTALMGASLPALVAGFRQRERFPRAVGLLYAANALGAGAGVLLTGFLLLPVLGRRATLLAVSAASLLVAAGAFALDRRLGDACAAEADADADADEPEPPAAPNAGLDLLACAAWSGFAGLALQVVATRLLVPVAGSSTYTFTLVLATVLAGIGLGGAVVGLRGRAESTRPLIGALLLAAALGIGWVLWSLDDLPASFAWAASRAGSSRVTVLQFGELFIRQGLIVAGLLLLPFAAIGAVLPLAAAGLRADGVPAGRAAGRAGAVNTAGAVAGALLAGLLLVPRHGTGACLLGLAAVSGAIGAWLTLPAGGRWRRAGQGASLVLLVLLLFAPPPDFALLTAGRFRGALQRRGDVEASAVPELVEAREGTNTTVSVFRSPNATYFCVNGKSDGSNVVPDLETQYLLGLTPALFARETRSACVIGLGTGSTVQALRAAGVAEIHAVELEPAIVEIARTHFADVNDGAVDAPEVRVHPEDGRTFLRYRDARYDVIVSEPSNPWVAGVSALFTVEFYESARARLAPGGVFCQWIQAYEMSTETLRALVATLRHVFPDLAIFYLRGDLVIVASPAPLTLDRARAEGRMARPAAQAVMARLEQRGLDAILVRLIGLEPGADGPFPASTRARNTDDDLWLEYRAPLEMYTRASPELPKPTASRLLEWLSRLQPDRSAPQLADDIARGCLSLPVTPPRDLEALEPAGATADQQRALAASIARVQARIRELERGRDLLARASQHATNLTTRAQAEAVLRILGDVEPLRPRLPRRLRVRALRLRGLAQRAQGQQAANVATLTELARLAPRDFETLTLLGFAHCRRGRYDEGLPLLERAVQLAPANVNANAALVSVKVRLGPADAHAIHQAAEARVRSADRQALRDAIRQRRRNLPEPRSR